EDLFKPGPAVKRERSGGEQLVSFEHGGGDKQPVSFERGGGGERSSHVSAAAEERAEDPPVAVGVTDMPVSEFALTKQYVVKGAQPLGRVRDAVARVYTTNLSTQNWYRDLKRPTAMALRQRFNEHAPKIEGRQDIDMSTRYKQLQQWLDDLLGLYKSMTACNDATKPALLHGAAEFFDRLAKPLEAMNLALAPDLAIWK
ncbi:unnamed protein product, partial [Prorocentrum cordatum]